MVSDNLENSLGDMPKDVLEVLCEISPVGITLVNRNGEVTYANTHAEKTLGLSKDTITQRTYNDPQWNITSFNGEPFPDEKLPFVLVQKTGKPVQDIKHAIELPSGTVRYLSINASPIFDDSGAFDGMIAVIEDISESVRVLDEVREQEEKFINLVKSSPMGMHMYRIDKNDRLIFTGANPAADKLLGLDNTIFIGKSIEEAFPPLSDTEVPSQYRRVATEGGHWQTVQIEYEDNQIKGAFEVHAFQTGPGTMAAMFFEITERKKTESALRESEERFRALFENTSEAIGVSDSRGLTVFTNRAGLKLFGNSSLEDVRGTSIIDQFAPSVRPQIIEYMKKRSAGEYAPTEYETRGIRRDGTEFDMEVNISQIEINGEMHTMGILRDVTEKKQTQEALEESEARFRALFENSRDAIGVINSLGKNVFVNQAYLDLFGYSNAEEMDGMIILDFFSPSERGKLAAFSEKRSKNGSLPGLYESIGLRKDGTEFDLEVLPSQLEINGEQHFMSIMRDVTERKIYERNLENALAEKETLIRDIHHRVKNNLLLLIDFLTLEKQSMIKKYDISVPIQNSFENTISRIHILASVYSQLYQPDSSLDNVPCGPFLSGLLEQIRSIYREGNNVSIDYSVDESIELPMRKMIPLGLITNEIMSNSFKYAFDPDEKGSILFKLKKNSSGDSVLSISDSGKGFTEKPEDIKEQSLGLRLIEAFSEQIGGDLTLDTEKGVAYTIVIKD